MVLFGLQVIANPLGGFMNTRYVLARPPEELLEQIVSESMGADDVVRSTFILIPRAFSWEMKR